MPKDRVILKYGSFSTVIAKKLMFLVQLLEAISQQVDEPSVRWGLQTEKTTERAVSIVGEGPRAAVEKVVGFLDEALSCVLENRPHSCNEAGSGALAGLTNPTELGTTALDLITPARRWALNSGTIESRVPETQVQPQRAVYHGARRYPVWALDAVRGRLQTISNRRGVRMLLYDDVFDARVLCSAAANQEELAHRHWPKTVVVVGSVRRDPQSGRPVEIRDVSEIRDL